MSPIFGVNTHEAGEILTLQSESKPYVVGITGGSGMILARRIVDWLRGNGHQVFITASSVAHQVWRDELDESFDITLREWKADPLVRYYGPYQFRSPIASGSFPIAGMVVVPCSMGTLAAIAHGMSTNLVQRAADCCIKEGRRLVLVPRETPLSAIHLENMLKLARLGARIVPPMPAFYLHPKSIDDVVDQLVGRALSALDVSGAVAAHHVYTGPDE